MLKYSSTKTYTHAEGLSCCFRQWRANSHCNKLHGYAIQVKLVFTSQLLDERNWVMDFGGLKQVKQYLKDTFDHKTLIAADDPQYALFRQMHTALMIDMVVLPNVGCEAFAQLIFDEVLSMAQEGKIYFPEEVYLKSVEVREHEGNSAIVEDTDA